MPRRAERAGPAMGEVHGTDRPPRGLRTARLRPDVSLQSTGAGGPADQRWHLVCGEPRWLFRAARWP